MVEVDVLLVADSRFAGGTSAALSADCRTLAANGAKVGLLFVASSFFDPARDPVNQAVLALRDLEGVEEVPSGSAVTAELAFFHNPLLFFGGFEGRADLRAKRSVIVTHQPPFRGDGSLEYDPLATAWRVRRAFGVWPWWAPISAVTRHQLQSFTPAIRLASEDWLNLFDPSEWAPGRAIFSGERPVVGRHGRADPLKWPATAAEIAATLPSDDGWAVRVLGCPVEELDRLGVDCSAWEVLPFGAEPARAFLDSLDVFSYFTAPRWVEAFGRTVVEAALMARPCVVEPRLGRTFGDFAIVCPAAEARQALAQLRDDPAKAREIGRKGQAVCADRYAAASLAARYERLLRDPGTADRGEDRFASRTLTARRMLGLYRRRLFPRRKDTAVAAG